MDKSIFLKPKLPPWLILLVLNLFAGISFGQSILRQSISPLGSSSREGSITFSQTMGQAYHTGSGATGIMTVRPGFQQSPRISFGETKSDPEEQLSLEYYPNPAQDRIILESLEEISQVSIRVVNDQGVLVHTQQLAGMKNHQVDCSHWIPGTYLLSIEEQTGKKRIIKIIILH